MIQQSGEDGDLVERYAHWIRDKTKVRSIEGTEWSEVTTPFLDRHNDHIQIYLRRLNGDYELTDDGYTIQDLRASGCELDTPYRRELLRVVLNGFGIDLSRDDQLMVRSPSGNLPNRLHNLVQAVIGVNDLFVVSRPNVQALFTEDVSNWLRASSVRFTPGVKLTGKSGFDHYFNFVIPETPGVSGERFVQAINRPDKERAELFAFMWTDVKAVRSTESSAFAVINDAERKPSEAVTTALRRYDVIPVLFSQREEYRETLAA